MCGFDCRGGGSLEERAWCGVVVVVRVVVC